MRVILLISIILYPVMIFSQNGYGNKLIFGRSNNPPSGTILNFNGDTLRVESVDKLMELEGSCAIMCDSDGKLLFYSNGCYIANATHDMMANGDSIGKGYLETSFCSTGGNPMSQSIIALPKPNSNHMYYLFYTDISDPYYMQPFFPLAPTTLYYSVIDMSLENGLGAVVEKNKVILQDTFSRGLIQAEQHINGEDWWIIQPKSHSNCYWTILLTENGIDTVLKQCIGTIWDDDDSDGQSVFSVLGNRYARMNYSYGLSIFEFDKSSGIFSNDINIGFAQDSFYEGGVAFSPNSRFVYASCYNKLYQFDMQANNLSASRILIGELNTPPNIQYKTRFNLARLAPDGKIYISGLSGHKHLHVIERPNCYGLECELQQYAIELASRNSYTMPNMPHYKRWSESDTCLTVSSIVPNRPNPNLTRLYPNPASQYVTLDGLESGDEVQLINISGKVIDILICQRNRIEIDDLKLGFYVLKVRRKGDYLGIFKFVKI